MRAYRLYLKDILKAIEQIETFVRDLDLDGFKNDDKTASAVVRCIPLAINFDTYLKSSNHSSKK